MQAFLDVLTHWLLTRGIRVVVIIVGAFIVIRILRLIIGRYKEKMVPRATAEIERGKRTETLSRILIQVARAVILTAAFLMCLKEVGIAIAPLLAGVGIVGLAVGFGAQSLVKDIISGFFILLENHMNVGDVVRI